ncbi:MAG: hypothetical protein ABR581_08815 [Thermoleophilaceae bacterium]
MARVALVCPDLLFGSKVREALSRAGHKSVEAGEPAEVLVLDLTDDVERRLRTARETGLPTLAFYSHVDQRTRARAEEEGVDRIVPRSRMAREAAALVESLLRDRS